MSPDQDAGLVPMHSFTTFLHTHSLPPQQHLDVWGADAKFSRRGAGDPLFHVSVHPAGAAPSLQEMVVLEAAAGDIPVKFAVVEKGDIGFYGFSHVRLQDIL